MIKQWSAEKQQRFYQNCAKLIYETDLEVIQFVKNKEMFD